MTKYSPIIMFAYNRPEHTAQALEKLSQNPIAQQSTLYVYADGSKSARDLEKVRAVREILDQDWPFQEVHVIKRERNVGLAQNVISGVREVVKTHGRVIVLEDDVLLAPYALDYFNDALNRYQDDDRVMHVGSYMYDIKRDQIPETFFSRLSMSQAWATWERAWAHYEEDIDVLIAQFDKTKIKAFTFDHTMNFWRQIKQQKRGEIDSWAIRWYASIFLRGGLALQTKYALLDNIGHDGSGVHSSISHMFDTEIQHTRIHYFPEVVEEDLIAYASMKYYFKHRKGSVFARASRFAINKWHKLFMK